MRRALTILKYLPAVLCGLLVVAWIAGFFWVFALQSPLMGGGTIKAGLYGGHILGWHQSDFTVPRSFAIQYWQGPKRLSHWLGVFRFQWDSTTQMIYCPIPFLLTLLLPLAIGPFNRFRFPLWSYFAFTALIA